MAATHHPSAQALANYLIGDCSPGAALLVAKHVERCVRCTSRIQAMGSVGAMTSTVAAGKPRALAPGLEVTPIDGASGLGEAVLHVRLAPGVALPADPPFPPAELLVLQGCLLADGEMFGVDDFLSLEETPKRELTADRMTGCTFLMTAEAALEDLD